MDSRLTWQIDVPIFKNSTIVTQLGIAIGIPFGVLLIFLIANKGYYGAILVGLLLFLTWIFIMIFYGGKYKVEFILDKNGARCKTQKNQAKKNKTINRLTVVLGLLSGKPTAAGAGMLAQSRQDIFIKWNQITKVKYKQKKSIIILKAGIMNSIVLFCSNDNYIQAKAFIKCKTKGK